jgi:FtsH-binding integral membrane protein
MLQMVDYNPNIARNRGATASAEVDVGLRSYMLGVYNYMAIGLILTGIVAYGVASIAPRGSELFMTLYASPLRWAIIFAPLVVVMGISFGINRLSASTAQLLFWLFAGLMGLSLSSVFHVYTDESIARTFFITAASFGALSLYGYTTKRDLTAFGKFLFMGLIGLLIASLVNLFFPSGAMSFAISVVGVLVFAGLTAYDTQKIKLMYYASDDGETSAKKSVMGALTLYLDFINMFMFLLQFLGNRRD